MSTQTILWLVAAGSFAGLVAQWIVLRSRYLRGITEQRARHQQAQQLGHQQLEQAKQQISHLQHALSLAKQQIVRQAQGLAAANVRPRPMTIVQRPREEASAVRRPPADGFADTLPLPQHPHEVSQLKH